MAAICAGVRRETVEVTVEPLRSNANHKFRINWVRAPWWRIRLNKD
jgi:hypothetical protein